jgi:SAM-dependent methyltransferase
MSLSASTRLPPVAAIQDAAVRVSRLLRDAKVDAPLRPKALAALVVAAGNAGLPAGAAGVLSGAPGALAEVNRQVTAALEAASLPEAQWRRLVSALHLGDDFERLAPVLPAIAGILDEIDVAHVLYGDFDFLGIFYEAFLRYGYDNHALGIVFTPRHITRFCVDLTGAGAADRVIDIACGTGGFLVPAYEQMCAAGKSAGCPVTGVVRGFDTNPTVWALAVLNLTFRGCRSALAQSPGAAPQCLIELRSCFEALQDADVRGGFTRAFLNPPFSQGAEPERDFLDAAMETLAPDGRCAAVVKAGIFADEEHAEWRAAFLRRHTVLAVISLPEDVFYPTSAPTSVLVAAAHVAQPDGRPVLMARVWNDGLEKLKNKRVERGGSELGEVKRCFAAALAGEFVVSPLAATVAGEQIKGGKEWSPQEWLPSSGTGFGGGEDAAGLPGPASSPDAISAAPHGADIGLAALAPERESAQAAPSGIVPEGMDRMRGASAPAAHDAALMSVLQAVAGFPELADAALPDFTDQWRSLPPLPSGVKAPLAEFFKVLNGKSAGEKRYRAGATPYISSGGDTNSIMRLVEPEEDELFADGGLTVTAFGQAAVQPWAFLARGNGGSAVRVLLPRYRMGVAELAWFAAQINAEKWRFFYARMAIKSRIERLVISAPPRQLPSAGQSLASRIRAFSEKLEELSRI